jgi:hypothetical protein
MCVGADCVRRQAPIDNEHQGVEWPARGVGRLLAPTGGRVCSYRVRGQNRTGRPTTAGVAFAFPVLRSGSFPGARLANDRMAPVNPWPIGLAQIWWNQLVYNEK